MPAFVLGADVHENVRNLRVALGSITDPLSASKFGVLVSERHPKQRRVSASQVQRWEQDVEPDLGSIAVMSKLAHVPFEEFALGPRDAASGHPSREVQTSAGGIPIEEVKRQEEGEQRQRVGGRFSRLD